MRFPRILILAGTLLALPCGCGGGGGPKGGSGTLVAVAAPTNLVATYEAGLLQITLTWTPPPGKISGYTLQAAVGNGAYQALPGTLGPKDYGCYLTFSSAPPEGVLLHFRVQAFLDAIQSEFSNVADVAVPLDAPSAGWLTYLPASHAMELSWTRNSTASTQVQVQRAVANAAEAATGPWTTLATLPAPTATYLDEALEEGSYYLYKVTNLDGPIASTSILIPTVSQVPLFIPTGLAATPTAQGPLLTWQNASSKATSITVLRGPGDRDATTVLATLDPQATSYVDTTAPFGVLNYVLVITDGTHSGMSAVLPAMGPTPAGALALSPKVLSTGNAGFCGEALLPDGTWVMAIEYSPIGIPGVAGLWPPWLSQGTEGVCVPTLQLTSKNTPALLYFGLSSSSSSDETLVQVAYDGAQWVQTTLPPTFQDLSGGMGAPDGVWALDRADNLHAVVGTYDYSGSYRVGTYTYLEGPAAAPVTTPLATLLPQVTLTSLPILVLDGAGTTHLFVKGPDAFEECSPAPDGTWTSTAILSGPALQGLTPTAVQMVGTEGGWLFATSAPTGNGGAASLCAIQKAGGAWQAPQTIYAMPYPSFPSCCATALSPDGTRCAALVNDATAGIVVLTPSGSTWIPTLVAGPKDLAMGIGFDRSNKLHILVLVNSSQSLVDYHE